MFVHCPFKPISVIDGQVRDKQVLQIVVLTVAVALAACRLGCL